MRYFFPSSFFQDFIFAFLQFEYDMPWCRVLFVCFIILAFILHSVFWTSWICGLVSDMNLREILNHYCFKYFFCFFLFLLSSLLFQCSHVTYVHINIGYPLDILFCFLPWSFLFLLFHLGSFSWHILKLGDSSSAMIGLLLNPSKSFFIYITVFLILGFFFNSFLEFPSLWLHAHLFMHAVYFIH